MSTRVLTLSGAINFRDLGGYATPDGRTLKWNTLYRCGKLDQLDDSAIKQLASMGIQTLIDFRYPDETRQNPTPLTAFPDATSHVWSSSTTSSLKNKKNWRELVEESGPEGMRQVMIDKYIHYLDSHAGIYTQLLDSIAGKQSPLVFHCSAGKDRTGVAAAIILSLLNVEREVIIKDYMLTQQQLGDKLEKWAIGGAALEDQYIELMRVVDELPFENIKPLFDADEAYLRNCLTHIDTTYGSVTEYAIQKLGLTNSKLQAIEDHLLN